MGRPIRFTVDARLLRELGERLVGRPHIALGELIKNSYDADATVVEITFRDDLIEVTDNGNGMNESTFIERWMRIGTTHKAREQASPYFRRPLTGSKGVGRLAAQLLATGLSIQSVALSDPKRPKGQPIRLDPSISAGISWADAVREKDLTSVTVDFTEGAGVPPFANGSAHGTRVSLSGLLAEWGSQEFRGLAQEIWALRPPFETTDGRSFSVVLNTPYEDVQTSFDDQMDALFDIANATITGRLARPGEDLPPNAERIILDSAERYEDEEGALDLEIDDMAARVPSQVDPARYAILALDLEGYPRRSYVVEIPDCQIDEFSFEVKVFDLVRRQPRGIKVSDARKYLATFGGVHLYDNGFHLPYYGPDNDWLRLELDHARRISRSRLLPEALQVKDGMQDLPSNKRVFGAANIWTSREQRVAAKVGRDPMKALAIQISRDRLSTNQAFRQLAATVRLGMDLYAAARARSKVRRALDKPRVPRRQATEALGAASQVVENVRDSLPAESYEVLREAINVATVELATRESEARAYASLLGSLATAGMTSLAYEHEVAAQRGQIDEVARQLRRIAATTEPRVAEELGGVALALQEWGRRSERIRSLFRPLLEEENRTEIGRYRARAVVEDVADTLGVLARRTAVDTGNLPKDLMLPPATYTAWSSVMQNILMNAFRATLESRPGIVCVDGAANDGGGSIRFQDNGVGGVDLSRADRLFLPFERAAAVTERAAALGLGGTGLGLTIVKMIADEVGCRVGFEQPDDGWSTAIRISWGK
ncbi:ATP-binding protein [Microbacterium sp. MMO-10]|uniref:ATP-binding protein n=1 Tax=Microbacterium sp. MMO-10 TaxID=3081272 RepID=UPI003019BEC2